MFKISNYIINNIKARLKKPKNVGELGIFLKVKSIILNFNKIQPKNITFKELFIGF